jgi:hypothetical protein
MRRKNIPQQHKISKEIPIRTLFTLIAVTKINADSEGMFIT